MADVALVTRVNSDLKALLAEAKGHREGPRFIAMIRAMVRLTNSPEDNKAMDAAAPPAPVCPHELVNRKTGKCVACGEIPEE